MRDLQVIEMRCLLFDCVCIHGNFFIIRCFTWTFLNGVDDAIDLIIGSVPTMIHDSIGNLLVAAKANDIAANPLDAFLREVADCKLLCAFWFREVDEKRMRDFLGHLERLQRLPGGKDISVISDGPQAARGRKPLYTLLHSQAASCSPRDWASSGSRLEYLDVRKLLYVYGITSRMSLDPSKRELLTSDGQSSSVPTHGLGIISTQIIVDGCSA